MAEHEAPAALHGDNHLPLLDRFYRGLLLRLAGVLVLEPSARTAGSWRRWSSCDANATRTSELSGEKGAVEEDVVDETTGEISTVTVRKHVEVSSAPGGVAVWASAGRGFRNPLGVGGGRGSDK
ncbi:hypothetical protein ABZW11_12485 [Nonomuraea sp. NPDC004580]|uniref:hypothetical protein n=1 Tax=Nonomuraea sp. NPDC004580 TaxID=3154552 RepID=UPI0033BE12F5